MGKSPYSATDVASSGAAIYARPLLTTLLLLALLTLFVSAGIWQLGRAEEKRQLLDSAAAAVDADITAELVADSAADAYRFRRFRLTGAYLPQRQILLDNMTFAGANGYQVLTPFQTGNRIVLVNRGWLAGAPDRRVLPNIEVSAAARTIVARLNSLPAPGLRIEAPPSADTSWPRRMLFPTRTELSSVLATELPDYQLLLEPDQTDGFVRDWQAVPDGPAKHFGYALQWFAFSVLAIIFYILLMRGWYRARHLPQETTD